MKKLAASVIVIALLGAFVWQYRIELLGWGAPKLRQVVSPIPENVPTNWTRGPEAPGASPNERPSNIILIRTDDMEELGMPSEQVTIAEVL